MAELIVDDTLYYLTSGYDVVTVKKSRLLQSSPEALRRRDRCQTASICWAE
jgi:hypothetical protein